MNIFFLDLEYSDSNLYKGEIFEIAVLSDKSGNIFHTYIQIVGVIPAFVETLCGVKDKNVKALGISFTAAMSDLWKFIKGESNGENSMIISHGNWDFPMITANLERNNISFSGFEEFFYINSVKIMLANGIEKPGLDQFAIRTRHSAVDDVNILQKVVHQYVTVRDLYRNFISFDEILTDLKERLPISFLDLFELVNNSVTKVDFKNKLYTYIKEKSQLKNKNMNEIADFYFNYFKN